jgi:hypothetical protein
VAIHALTRNFNYFFGRLNPGSSFIERAASQHGTITGLIESPNGLASILSPKCFLQGSYRQNTAIYTINDVDIVALCALWYPGTNGGRGWSRDEIFQIIAAPLLNDGRYKDKVRYTPDSTCIKVDLGIKVEILPVVYKTGSSDSTQEPFYLYRPEESKWVEGFARYHQRWLSWKNSRTYENFIPVIKIFKHLNAKYKLAVTSFYIECLLFSLPESLFQRDPATYIAALLNHISSMPLSTWRTASLKTPCEDRDIFTNSEWSFDNWQMFHESVVVWNKVAQYAIAATDQAMAIQFWQLLLGEDFFPNQVS